MKLQLPAKGGESVGDYIKRAIAVAAAANDDVECEHNGTKFTVYPDHYQQVCNEFWRRREPGEEQ